MTQKKLVAKVDVNVTMRYTYHLGIIGWAIAWIAIIVSIILGPR